MADGPVTTLVATLGEGRPPNGQVVKARAVEALLSTMGPVHTIEPRTGVRALRQLVHAVRQGAPVVVALNRRGAWVALVICGVFRSLSRRRSQIVVIVVGGWMPRLIKHWWYSGVMAVADDLLVESSRLERELESLGPKVTRFPNFRDLPVDDALVRGPLDGPVRLCCAGRVRLDKGVLEAAALVQVLREGGVDATLDVLGPVEDRQVIDVLREHPACSYRGQFDPRDAVSVLAGYHFLVLPSSYEGECQPGSVVEACFAGLPAIVSDWQDLPEMVRDGVTGFVCPLSDFAHTAAGRIRACIRDGSLPSLSRAALDHAASDLTADAARKVLDGILPAR